MNGKQGDNSMGKGAYDKDVSRRVISFPPFESFVKAAVDSNKPDLYGIVIQIVQDVVLLALIASIVWIPVSRAYSAQQENKAIELSKNAIGKWPQADVVGEYHADQQYNAAIDRSGQWALGEILDPFSDDDSHKDLQAERDKSYQARLNTVDGIMGTIRIPKISVKLPIYHGTSDAALSKGAGHLYGTSLPIGGKSTNTVLSGHRGLANAVLFTRLDELKVKDIIYLDVLKRTIGYRVTGIHVISPEDTDLYKVVPGKDLLTLMTCTPYGVNTRRLIITAERGKIPEQIPANTRGDSLLVSLLVFAGTLLAGIVVLMIRRARYDFSPIPWHFSGEFSR